MYRLPVAMRAELAQPMAPVRSTMEALPLVKDRFLVSVGDVCSEEFLENGVQPHVMIVDWKTQRHDELDSFKRKLQASSDAEVVKVANPAAVITRALYDAIERALRSDHRSILEVEGEEDLAALPCILLAPDGAIVAYGQPNEGVVLVTVDAQTRERARVLLERMEASE